MLFPSRRCANAAFALGCLTLLASGEILTAQTLIFRQGANGYTDTRDSYIRDDQPITSLATSTAIRVDGASPVSHGLLQFDNIFGTGPGQIPPAAEIISARLTLRTIDPGDTVEFHRMLIDWSDTNTWNWFTDGLNADNVEMMADPEAVFTPAAPIPRVDSIDVTASVQAWSAGAPNHGWGIISTGTDGWLVQSSESTVVSNRPALTVTFRQMDCLVHLFSQPTNWTALECQAVTFAVNATGCRLQYQWYKDGVLIEAATNSSYAISHVYRSDSGSAYNAVVYNEFGSMTSAPAVLTVSLDVVAPRVLCAYSGQPVRTRTSLTNNSARSLRITSELISNFSAIRTERRSRCGHLSMMGQSFT